MIALAASACFDAPALPASCTILCPNADSPCPSGLTCGDDNFCHREPTENSCPILWDSVDVGVAFTCAIRQGGMLYCWGANQGGQLGIGSQDSQALPTRVGSEFDWVQISVGKRGLPDTFAQCSMCPDGFACVSNACQYDPNLGVPAASYACGIRGASRQLYCWGDGSDVSLGLGSNAAVLQTEPTQIAAGTAFESGWQAVSVRHDFSCGIGMAGQLYCWGNNLHGETGLMKTLGETSSPEHVHETADTTDWSTISVGQIHACGTRVSGRLFCWGYEDTTGQTGLGMTTAEYPTPQSVTTGVPWRVVATARSSTCAIRSDDDSLSCWGANSVGQLGNNKTATGSMPTVVNPGTRWASVSGGEYSACAISKTDGSLSCWGLNSNGVLGVGDTATRYVPTPVQVPMVDAPQWKQVSVGLYHACGILIDGTLYCWGHNEYGQLGIGMGMVDTTVRPSPVPVERPAGIPPPPP